MPTTPALASLKGTIAPRGHVSNGDNYYSRALSLTSVAGIGRLPLVSLPLAEFSGGYRWVCRCWQQMVEMLSS
jgi:hypothetical protein